MNERNNKLELLGSAPIPKALMALGIPIMIGMLINALYNLVDAYFVSGLGKSQMGAISVVFPLGQVVVGLGLMFGNGAASYLSRLLGRGDKDTADKVASTALYSSILIGAIIILLSAIFLKPILVMLGATETIMPYALTYARIYVLSCVFNVFNVTMNNIVSSEGAAKTTMCALLLGAVLNIGLDPLFIYTLDMGVEGAAIATAISQMVSTLVYLTYVLRKKSVFSFSIKEFSPTRQMITEILKIGVPTLVFQLLTSLSIGPNGAGKSTTMKMLLGLTAPTKGSFTIDGKQFPQDRIAILKEIGSFIEAPSFYANLTGRENLDIIRRILGLSKADVEDALELVGLTEFGDRLAKQYSLGMKQRLGLAGALLGRPPILILDEPTNGFDPSGIHEIRNLVKSLPSLYDCTVLISSHMLSEIELIADDIGILNHGRLLFEGSMNDLRQYALQSGFAADNLEDVFLSMVEKDNMDRKQRAKL